MLISRIMVTRTIIRRLTLSLYACFLQVLMGRPNFSVRFHPNKKVQLLATHPASLSDKTVNLTKAIL